MIVLINEIVLEILQRNINKYIFIYFTENWTTIETIRGRRMSLKTCSEGLAMNFYGGSWLNSHSYDHGNSLISHSNLTKKRAFSFTDWA